MLKALLCLAILPFASSSNAAQRSFYTRPDIHGDLVVFTCEGDLWLGDLQTKSARRITSDPGIESFARFSPDGSQIAFTANYDGGTDAYVMPVSGDSPRRLTYDPAGAQVLGWSPDGNEILYRSSKEVPVGFARHFLYKVSVFGGQSKRLPVPQGEFASLSSDGQLAYVPVSNEWANWFRYRAGRRDSVWITDLSGSFKKVADSDSVDTTPVWVGQVMYFVSERDGVSNLYAKTSSGIREVTHYTDAPVRYPGSDGRRVVFQHGPGLAMYDPQTQQTTELAFDMRSDRLHAREMRVPVNGNASNLALGPTGKRVVLESRGQIVSVAADQGDFRVLENKPGTRAIMPAWSPDGKKVAFVSDRTGENEIWTTDSAGGAAPTQLTHDLKVHPFALLWAPDGEHLAVNDREGRILLIDAKLGTVRVVDQSDRTGSYDSSSSFVFSPDGKYIAYDFPLPNWIDAVKIAAVSGGPPVQVTNPLVESHDPGFTADGKFLLFLANTNFSMTRSGLTHKYSFDNEVQVYMVPLSKDTASPFLAKTDEEVTEALPTAPAKPVPSSLDAEGIGRRLIQLPIPAGDYQKVEGINGKVLLLNAGQLSSFDIEKPAVTPVSSGVTSFSLSKDRKKLLLVRGRSIQIADANGAPVAPSSGDLNLAPYSLVVQPDKEWSQIFDETWRVARDFFYDPNMHGVNWNRVREIYKSRMSLVADRSDLTRLLADMLSELNSGHAYVRGPSPFGGIRIPMGFLGADYEAVPGSDAVRIKKLYEGDPFSATVRSPLLEPGMNVHEGDYIVTIAGQPVKAGQDIQALLLGTVNQTIAIAVNTKPSLEGSRVVRVKPLVSEQTLRYQDWVMHNVNYVRRNGGDNFGYTHFSDMGTAGVIGFTKGAIPNADKDAMIYDDRFNGGGNVSSLLLENIAAHPIAWWKPRYGGYWTRENWANGGYKAALCNEFDFSDGELFVETWKRMNIGPVIGHTTGGGEVGSGGGFEMIDSGVVNIPNYAAFADGRWLVEGVGAQPDIAVEEDPAAVMAGKDPQLDRAIEILKAKLAKNPIKRPVHPAFPNKALRG